MENEKVTKKLMVIFDPEEVFSDFAVVAQTKNKDYNAYRNKYRADNNENCTVKKFNKGRSDSKYC